MDLILPQSPETESTIIGLIFKDNTLIWLLIKALHADDFYVELHQQVVAAMIVLANEHKPIDYITVQEQINKIHNYTVEKARLATFINHLPENPQIEEYFEIVYLKSIERKKARLHNAAQTAIMTGKDASKIQGKLEEVSVDRRKKTFSIISEKTSELLEQIYDYGVSNTHITGLRTGYRKLDYLTSGLQKQDLTILAARPSTGKTALALCMAENICESTPDTIVCMFSLEMSEISLKKRLLASMARIDMQKLRNGFLSKEEWIRLLSATKRLTKYKLFINDEGGLTPLEMKAKTKILLNEQKKLDLIIVDYIQLMGSDEKTNSIEQETSKNSKALKEMAKEFDVPVLALSQLSRAPESRTDHKPQLSDLRYSGSLEQDADLVVFIYREERYEKTQDNEGLSEIILAKQRNGPTGTVPMYFIKSYTRFEGISPKFT